MLGQYKAAQNCMKVICIIISVGSIQGSSELYEGDLYYYYC